MAIEKEHAELAVGSYLIPPAVTIAIIEVDDDDDGIREMQDGEDSLLMICSTTRNGGTMVIEILNHNTGQRHGINWWRIQEFLFGQLYR